MCEIVLGKNKIIGVEICESLGCLWVGILIIK